MPSSRRTHFLRNDLQTVSVVAIGLIILSLALEMPSRPMNPDFEKGMNRIVGGEENGTVPENKGPPVTNEVELISRGGYTSEGYTTEEPFSLTETYVSHVAVDLTWTDDIGSNDEFGMTLERDGLEVGMDSGTTGSLHIEVTDDSGALSGNYTVVIEAIHCPGLVGPVPVDRDTGNPWDLTVKASIAEATTTTGTGDAEEVP